MFAAAGNLTLVLPRSTRGHYSNFGVAMLGNALAARLETSFPDLVASGILNPLRMNATGFNYTKGPRIAGSVLAGLM